MSESLEKKKIDLLNEIKNQSLRSKMSDLKTKIANLNKYKNLTLLCDVSGSMSDYISNHESNESVRAIDVLNNIAENFEGAQIFEFASTCNKVRSGVKMNTKGSTRMDLGFATVKAHGINEVILLTDGEPDNENEAIREAQGLKLNIIYIGPAPTPSFLKKLAKQTGGTCDEVELMKLGIKGQKEIENKIKGFLNA